MDILKDVTVLIITRNPYFAYFTMYEIKEKIFMIIYVHSLGI